MAYVVRVTFGNGTQKWVASKVTKDSSMEDWTSPYLFRAAQRTTPARALRYATGFITDGVLLEVVDITDLDNRVVVLTRPAQEG